MLKRTLLTISIAVIAFSLYGCKEKPATQEPSAGTTEPKPATPKPIAKPVAKEPVAAPTTIVKLSTSKGDVTIELFADKSPITVKNFLGYVNSGFYDGTIFHRVMKGFMIQGGGLTTDMTKKPVRSPIKNETQNRVRNKRGTIAMARQNPLDSATSQFFINHVDNRGLDFDGPYGGYAVFGKVVKGMEIVDRIAMVRTTTKAGRKNVPVEPVVIESAKVVSN